MLFADLTSDNSLLELRSLLGEISTNRETYMRAYNLAYNIAVGSPRQFVIWKVKELARVKGLFSAYESHIIKECVHCLEEIVTHPNPTHRYHEVFTSFSRVAKATVGVFSYVTCHVIPRMRESGYTQVIDLEDIAMLMWRDIVLRRLLSMRRNGQPLLHGLRMDDAASLVRQVDLYAYNSIDTNWQIWY